MQVMTQEREQFISEAIKPDATTFDTRRMAMGAPGLPGSFTWRKAVIHIARVRNEWQETGPCTHGSGERYVRKHWYEVEDAEGRVLKIYFERKPRSRSRARWRLFSITAASST